MRVRITRPAVVGGRTFPPGLTVALADQDAQRILALGNAVALDAPKTTTRKLKPVETRDAAT